MPDGARHLILAAATGYRWPQLAAFVSTLRRTGYAGDVVMLVGKLPRADAARLRDAGVTLWHVHPALSRLPTFWRRKFFSRRLGWLHRGFGPVCDTLPLPQTTRRLTKAWCGRVFHHVACSRYFFYLAYLHAHAARYDRVLLTDVRDVVFQADPFSWESGAPLQFFLEHRGTTIGGHPGNALWMRNAYGEAALAQLARQRVSCSGVTFGSTEGMLRYLAAMTDQIAAATPRISGFDGYDQAVHNHLIHTNAFPDAELLENGRGPVLTMHGVPTAEFRLAPDGRLLDDAGRLVPVLHQYDRHPPLRERLHAALAWPEFPAG